MEAPEAVLVASLGDFLVGSLGGHMGSLGMYGDLQATDCIEQLSSLSESEPKK